MRKQHDQIDIVETGKGVDRSTAGIAEVATTMVVRCARLAST